MRSIASALCFLAALPLSAQVLLTGPNQLTFSATAGGAAPAAQSIAIRHGGDTPLTTNITASTLTGGNWLSVSALSATTPSKVTVNANSTNLPVGTYTGTILISAPGVNSSSVNVTLNVVAQAALSVSPQNLTFRRSTGVTVEPGSDEQLIFVNSTGSATGFTATGTTTDGGSWLQVITSGSTTPGVVIARVNSGSLAAGTYTGQVAITAPNMTTVNVPVSLTVGASQFLTVSPAAITVSALRNGSTVNRQLTLTSATSAPFTATPTSTPAGWLIITPQIGTSPGTIDVSLNPAGLPNGTYNGSIQIAPAGGTGQAVIVPVSFTVTDQPLISVSTESISLTVNTGGAASSLIQPLPTINVTSTVGGAGFTPSVTTFNGGSWLTAGPSIGAVPGTIQGFVDATGLAPGTYSGQITVSGSGNTVTIPVKLVVSGSSSISVDPGTITFNYQKGQTTPSNQIVNISSSGAAYAYVSSITSITPENATWLSGAVTQGTTPGTITLGLNPIALASLAAGQYRATVTFAPQAGYSPVPPSSPKLDVVLNVSETALFNVTPAFLDLTAPVNGNPPAARNLTVIMTDGSSRPFTANVSTTSGGSGWLLAGPTSGNTPASISVQVLPFGLPVGRYEGTIQITVQNVATPITVPVRLTVQPTATLGVAPTALSFTQPSGGVAPATQTLTLTSVGGTGAYSLTTSTVSGGGWLTVNPQSGSTPGTVTVSVNGAGLAPGIYQGSIGIASSDVSNGPVQIPVTFTVTAPSLTATPASVTLASTPGSTTAVTQDVTITAGASGYTAVASTINGGNWLTVNPASGTTGGKITITANPSGLIAGTYTGTVVVTSAGVNNSPLTIPVTFNVVSVAPAGRQILAQIADGAGWRTTITLVNLDTVPASYTLRFYSNEGTLALPFDGETGRLESLSGTIAVGGSRTITTTGTTATLSQGWAELTSTQNISGLGIFRQRVAGRPDQEAAVSAVTPSARFVLPYDNTQGFVSGIAIANTAAGSRAVSVTPKGEDGVGLITDSVNLPSRGQTAFTFSDRFPVVAARRGAAEFSSTGADFAALGLRFNTGGAFTSLPALDVPLTAPSAEVSQVISQVADGGGWKTVITLVNLDSQAASFTLRFWRADGSALVMPLQGALLSGVNTSVVEGTIQPGGTYVVETLGGDTALVQGWAQLSSARNVSGLAVFRQRVTGRPDQEAAVTLTSTGSRMVLPFDNTGDFTTAMALVNSSSTLGSTIAVVIRDENGVQIGADTISLGSRAYVPFALTDRFVPTRGRRGTIEFNSTTQITGLGLRFNNTGSFTSFPVLRKP
jgi:hypothetical protein